MDDELRLVGLAEVNGAYKTTVDGHIAWIATSVPPPNNGLVLCHKPYVGPDPAKVPTCATCVSKYHGELKWRGQRTIWEAGHQIDTWEWMDDSEIADASGVPDELIERSEP